MDAMEYVYQFLYEKARYSFGTVDHRLTSLQVDISGGAELWGVFKIIAGIMTATHGMPTPPDVAYPDICLKFEEPDVCIIFQNLGDDNYWLSFLFG